MPLTERIGVWHRTLHPIKTFDDGDKILTQTEMLMRKDMAVDLKSFRQRMRQAPIHPSRWDIVKHRWGLGKFSDSIESVLSLACVS